MGKRLGDADDPLLVSVRSGAKFSMPGMMDTVLNLGLNDVSVQGLADQTGDERFAYDSYRRFVSMYGRIVLDVPGEEFETRFEEAKEKSGVDVRRRDPAPRPWPSWSSSTRRSWPSTPAQPFPQDPADQLRGAIEAVFQSWGGARAVAYRVHERIPHDLGTAVNVQAMVFGNRDDNSGTGVGFTRDPATGEAGAYGDFLVNAQGEDVVAGIRNTLKLAEMQRLFPSIYDELLGIFDRLERHYRDMCDTEFTIDQGKLWMLQTRVGKRGGVAALRMAVDMTTDERMTAVARGGRPAGHRRAPRAGPAPPGRRGRRAGDRHRAGRVAGRRRGQGLLHRRRRGRGRRAGRGRDPGPQRDVAGGRPRHDRGQGHPDRRGAGWSATPPSSPGVGGRRRWSAPTACI